MKLALLGAGGFGKEVAEVAELQGHAVTGCYSLTPGAFRHIHKGYKDELIRDRVAYDGVVLCVGAVNRRTMPVRRELIDWLKDNAFVCPPLVSPHAVISKGAIIADGAFVAHGVVVSVDAVIGEFSVLNSSCIIGHSAVIGPNVTVAPGAFIGGAVNLGEDSIVGPMAKVLQGLSVGRGAIVGVGTSVLRSIADGVTVWPSRDQIS